MPFTPKTTQGSFKPKVEEKNFGEKAGELLGFDAFGKGIASVIGNTKQLDATRAEGERIQNELLARRKANAAAGKDTSRLDAALKDIAKSTKELNARQLSIDTGGGLSNREVIGSAINVAATLPAGFGGITAAKTSFRPAFGAVTNQIAKKGLKAGIKPALGILAAEGAVAGGLGGLGFGLMDKEKDAAGVLGSAAIGAAAGGVLAPAIGAAAIPVIRAGQRALSPAIRKAEQSTKLDRLVGAISQGKTPKEIAQARQAYSQIDPEGIKTYQDLKDALDDKIAETSNGLDEVLVTNTTKKTLADLTASVKVGDETVEYNYVNDALDQLEDFYVKTNDVAGQTRIAQRRATAEADGLTIKEVNDIAKEHGINLNAYNANGQLASGLSKQAAENTRKGLKATARQEFNDPVYSAADKEIASLIRARDLAGDMATAVTKLQNKIKDRTIGEKAGRLAYQIIDLLSLGSVRGFIQAAIPRGQGLKTLNALDLERQLEKSLKEFQKLVDETPEGLIVPRLQSFLTEKQAQFSDAPLIKNPTTQSAASIEKNVVIPQQIPQTGQTAIPAARPPVDSMFPSKGVPVRDSSAVNLPVSRQIDVVDESIPGNVTPEIRKPDGELPSIQMGSVPRSKGNLPVIDATPEPKKSMLPPVGTKIEAVLPPAKTKPKALPAKTTTNEVGSAKEAIAKGLTEDEFVKAQTKIFHGTDKSFEKFDTSKMEGGVAYFTDSLNDFKGGNPSGSVGTSKIMERHLKPNLRLGGYDEADKFSTDELIQQGYSGLKLEKDGMTWYEIFNPNEDLLTTPQLRAEYQAAKSRTASP